MELKVGMGGRVCVMGWKWDSEVVWGFMWMFRGMLVMELNLFEFLLIRKLKKLMGWYCLDGVSINMLLLLKILVFLFWFLFWLKGYFIFIFIDMGEVCFGLSEIFLFVWCWVIVVFFLLDVDVFVGGVVFDFILVEDVDGVGVGGSLLEFFLGGLVELVKYGYWMCRYCV